MILKKLQDAGLIHAPQWLPENTMYLTQMGSVVYGCATDNSDMDYYGFCIPHKDMVFPHLRGEIAGFGKQTKRFNDWSEHHINSPDGKKTYDFSVYSIVRFFQLCMENNPNMVDALFVPSNCIVHCTHIGNLVRDNRQIFLHKGSFHKFRGYAFSQLHKMNREPTGKRKELVEKFGYDTKFASHVIRLLNECEQILGEGDLDLQRSKEQLKSIRRGEWTEQQIRDYFERNDKRLEQLYADSKLPYGPDETEIKKLLLKCLEYHYGTLENCIVNPDEAASDLRKIAEIASKWS